MEIPLSAASSPWFMVVMSREAPTVGLREFSQLLRCASQAFSVTSGARQPNFKTSFLSHFNAPICANPQETAAAIKVQAAFRRNKALRDLEKEGITTAAIRNAQRRRKAQQRNAQTGTADIPSLFQCCGVGLAFGDATEEDYEAARQHEKEQYEERKKARERREEELRQNYIQAQKAKQTPVKEIIEVVDEPGNA
jgi:hypothetical protein